MGNVSRGKMSSNQVCLRTTFERPVAHLTANVNQVLHAFVMQMRQLHIEASKHHLLCKVRKPCTILCRDHYEKASWEKQLCHNRGYEASPGSVNDVRAHHNVHPM